jgi:hypothetical protein
VVRERLQGLLAQRLPRVRELGAQVREHASRWQLEPLDAALGAQRAAIAALQFPLLVPVGLRAGSLPRQKEAFRRQVTDVARCAELAWTALQGYLQDCAVRGPGEGHALFAFSRALRHLEQHVAEAAQLAAGAMADLHLQSAATSSAMGRQGYAGLSAKAAELTAELARLQAACTAGRLLRDTAVGLADEREALAAVLRRQAQGLAPPLLKNLAHVIAPGVRDTPDQLRHARLAAAELTTSIDGALAQVAALREEGRRLLAAADALGAPAAAAPPLEA